MSEEFYNKFEMQVRPSHRRLRRMKPPHLRIDVWNSHLTDELVWNLTDDAEEVDCLDITMPVDRLVELEGWLEHYANAEKDWRKQNDRSGKILAQHHKDQQIRIKNQMVKQAYDHYLILLNLCR